MKDFVFALVGVLLMIYGLISLITPFLNRDKIRWIGDTHDYLFEWIIGKREFNILKNLIWGVVSMALGIFITLYYSGFLPY